MEIRIFSLGIILCTLATGCLAAATPNEYPTQPPVEPGAAATPTATIAATEQITVAPTDSRPTFDFSQPLNPVPVSGSFQFAEGPATAIDGSVYFSDINAGKIYHWLPDGSVSLFMQGLDMPNGSQFDSNGNLIVCEGGKGRLISIDPQGRLTILVDKYNGVHFNEPNDLWINPQGGLYFTDPTFHSPVVQGGQDVYYVTSDHSQVIRVISDMLQPNGIVGTRDGKMLYVADYGAGQTFRYDINSDGSLSNKTLFVSIGSDGMKLDAAGNVYLTTPNQVQIFSPAGVLLKQIPTQEVPTNLAFAGTDGQTLFITARTAVYTVHLAG